MKSLLTAITFIFFIIVYPVKALSQQCDNWLLTPNQPSYFRIGDLDIPGDKITVEAVFTRTAPWNGVDLFQGDLVSKHDDPKDVNYLLRPSSAEITTTNGYFKTPTICPIELNKTYHAAMVYDGTTLKFYRNGFLMSQIAASGNLYQNDWQTQIGLFFNERTQENFVGYIKEVRIWNIVRTQSEIKNFMDRPLLNPQTTSGLLAYYNFDDLKNKQGNAKWDGHLGGNASIKQTNPNCNFIADSCGIVPTPPVIVRAGFTTPDTVCVNTPITITNTSTGASSYYWNFCVADANTPPQGVNMGNIGGVFKGIVYVDYVQENGNYYGFVTDNYSYKLYRLDFGSSLLNSPAITDLGNVSGVIPSETEGIQVVKNEGKWYAIIVGGDPGGGAVSRIVKIEFGTYITNNNPIGIDWGNIGNLAYPHDLYLFDENGHWYGFTVNTYNSTITRFDFTNSFANKPTAANLGNVGDLNAPTGVHAIKDGQSWHVFVTNATNSTLSRLDFGNSLLNIPTGTNLGNIGGRFHTCWDIYIMKYCGSYVGFIINGDRAYNDLLKVDFNNNLSSTPSVTSFGNIGNLNFPHCISRIFRAGPDLYTFIPNVGNQTLSRLRFVGCTSSNIPNSVLQNPPAIIYNTPGTYNINLTIDDGLATQSAFCRNVVVMPSVEHKATKAISVCSGDSVLLSSGNNLRNQWSTGSTAHTIYVHLPGTYWVQSSNGACTNIDSFVVSKMEAPFSINLGKDTAICKGDSIVLDAANAGAAYIWQNGQTTQTFTAYAPGNYSVAVHKNGCMVQDTIIINQLPAPTLTLSNDTTICPSGKATLQASGGTTYLWSPSTGLSQNNIPNPIATLSTTTTYTVAVTDDNGCIQYDSLVVSVKSKPTFTIQPVSQPVCLGDTITLKVSGGDLYEWMPSQNLSSPTESLTKAFPQATTPYKVIVKDAYCNFEDTLYTTVVIKPRPVVRATKSNDLDCSNGQAQLVAVGATDYEWTPASFLSNSGIANPIAAPDQTTTFYVKGTNEGCSSTDSITVNVTNTGSNNFYLPNAFTPNSDGMNDCLGIKYWGSVKEFSMKIYNRWGEIVFASNNPSKCWDGFYKGKEQPGDIYVYYIKAKTLCGDVIKKGTIMLIR